MAILTESWILDLSSFVLTIITGIYLYFRYCYSYWDNRGVPYLTPRFPFGNTKDLAQQKENFGLNIQKKYNELKKFGTPYGGFFMFYKPILLILDPELIKSILIKEFNKFPDRGIYFNEIHDPLSANMFSLRGQKWKTMRNKISPTFTSGKMKMMFETLTNTSERLEKVLEQELKTDEIIGVKDLLARFTTDVIGSCVFGIDCNSLKNPNTDFRKFGTRFLDTVLSNTIVTVLGFIAPGLLDFFKIKSSDDVCSDFFLNMLKDTIDYREKNEIHRRDFMDLFIRLKNNENIQDDILIPDSKFNNKEANEGLTFLDLAPQALVFFIAGYETSSTTSSLCLLELAQNLDIQTKLRDEIKTVLKKHDDKITYDGIMEMHYLDQVINEILRKYPIAPNLARVCREDFKVPNSNLVIEKGTMTWISVLGIHMDPKYYPNPEKFDPDRFSPEENAKRIPYTYLPFGEGPRNCVGMRFALMQTKVAIAAILKDYQFEACSKTQIPIKWSTRGILLFPADEMWLRATKI